MVYLILLLFLLAGVLSYFEPFMGKYRLPVYLVFGLALVALAGFREIGVDPDSAMYEFYYRYYYTTNMEESVEYSYRLLSLIFNIFSTDVHTIFLFYAFFGILLKLVAIRNYSETWFLCLLVYLSFYYEFHELTQIRTGLLSGFFLLAVSQIAEGRRFFAFLLLACGTFFHSSGLALLPLLFLSNKELTGKRAILWLMVPLAGYVAYLLGSAILLELDLPYIGEKLANYQEREEKGTGVVAVKVFGLLQVLSLALFYYLFFFQKTLMESNKYFPLMLRVYAIGLFAYSAFAFLPVVADRLSYQFRLVTIFLYANVASTIRPKWAGLGVVILIAFVFLNYTFPYIFHFNLLFKG